MMGDSVLRGAHFAASCDASRSGDIAGRLPEAARSALYGAHFRLIGTRALVRYQPLNVLSQAGSTAKQPHAFGADAEEAAAGLAAWLRSKRNDNVAVVHINLGMHYQAAGSEVRHSIALKHRV